MGMQFVTLFLIVIAIILFGIMGTLEGREFAALLGGLSGHILGKAGFNRESQNPNQDPNPVPNPNPVLNPTQY
jgi:Na+-transporting methylmalonyl-CoA/oxaloacetate decarboxylase gamma subunit